MNGEHEFPIFDGHNDTLMSLFHKVHGERSFFERSDRGQIDLPRAKEGGFAGGMFAVFIPAEDDPAFYKPVATATGYEAELPPSLSLGYAQRTALAVVASLFRLEEESDGAVKVARTADDLAACLQQDTLAMVLHFEGAEAIDPDLDALHVFYQAGLRSLGICWSRPNIFGHGVPFKYPGSPDTGPGLTEFGYKLVQACNHLGIVVDMAHLNEKGFWNVASVSDAPLVVSHAGAHGLCSSCRNVTDTQLDAIGESGGVLGVTFFRTDLREDGRLGQDAPLTAIVRHIDYIAERIGIDHVALGSDFDGARIPAELGDVSGLPKLIAALRDHGYDADALRKITHENWMRVLRQTWKS